MSNSPRDSRTGTGGISSVTPAIGTPAIGIPTIDTPAVATPSAPASAASPHHAQGRDNLAKHPPRITKASWKYASRTAVREFIADECVDLANGLTFRMLLSVFPALVALVSILSLLGQSGSAVTQVLDEAERVAPPETWNTVRPLIDSVLDTPAPGWGLVLGLAIALWSASGYVKAFGRAMNTVVGVPEGRGLIRFNVVMYLLTALILVLGAVALLVFVLSGPIAEAVGGVLGLGAAALAVWNVAKWFLLAGIVVLVVALLYHATPNIKQPRFRWLSIGALIAIIVSILASLGFSFYVSQFGTFNAMYGALTGVIILMLWIFLINAILLFGAQLDCELERVRQLQEGLPAEEDLQLPVRSTKASDKQALKYAEDLRKGRNLRFTAGASQDDPAARPPRRH